MLDGGPPADDIWRGINGICFEVKGVEMLDRGPPAEDIGGNINIMSLRGDKIISRFWTSSWMGIIDGRPSTDDIGRGRFIVV